MKRLTSLAVLLLCSLLTFAQYSGSGNGTEEDPYLIFNETQLSQMSNFLGQEGVVFKLMKDLNLTAWIAENNPSQGWIPVGVASAPFQGKFLGNGKKISGLKIQRTNDDNVGFFGYVCDAIIQDLTLEGTTVIGKESVGTLVGQAIRTTFNQVYVSLSGAAGVSGVNNIGGIAGKVTNCTFNNFSVTSSVNGTSLAGGMIGYISGGTYENGQADVTVTATQGSAGGFAGQAVSYTLNAISVNGDISGTANGCMVGGIIAISEGVAQLSNCNSIGNLTATETGEADAGSLGGAIAIIKGGSSVTFTNCFSKGLLNHSSNYTGGIVGKSEGSCIANMESCSHFGDIQGTDYVGGVIGAMLDVTIAPTLHRYEGWGGYSGSDENRQPVGTKYETLQEKMTNGSKISRSINNCTAIGNINGSNWIGGIIGLDLSSNGYSSTTSKNTKNAMIFGYENNKYTYIGEFYPGSFSYYTYTRSTVSYILTNNYYSGTIRGANYVGGLVGRKGGGDIQNCYAYANIYGDSHVGGIVGEASAQAVSSAYCDISIKSNVANCQTISATSSDVGRIYGSLTDEQHTTIGALGSAEGNRALTQNKLILQGVVQDVVDDLQNGTSIGPSLLRLKATYVSMGWDFETNWDLQETECYPYKKYQAAPPVIESNLVSQATNISGKSLNGGTVYLYYKNRDAVSANCNGHQWNFSTEALQSGAQVQIYADVEGMTPSYFTSTFVGYPGSGTEDDPYRIYTAEDLQGASNLGYYKVMNDIDLTAWIAENSPEKGWPAIGRNSGEVTYIDGDGHKISGLWINAPDENFTGLFSNFSAGQIKNLNVEVATGKKVRGGDYTGVLIGRNANGRIVNCSVCGDVEGTAHVGGVAGYTEATTISAVSYDGHVGCSSANANAGGLVGQMKNCDVNMSNAIATITTTGETNRVGGLAGEATGGSITKSMSNVTTNVAGTGSYLGGFVGYSQTPITLCFSSGSTTATGEGSFTGGLVGYALSPITNCYSTATTTGTDFTAGLVGYSFAPIDKCYAKGDVYGVNYGGGVVGELDGSEAKLTNSVACNNKLSLTAQASWGSRVIGGYKNGAADPDESNYALSTMQVSLNNVPQTKTDDIVEGQARTADQLMHSDTYIGLSWDLTDVWGIDEGQMYPYLLWEIDINPVADVSLNKTSLLVAVGNTEMLTASVLPLGATNKRLAWTSNNTNVATVADGLVTAVGVGSAVITATSTDGTNISATCNVTVTANHDAAIAQLQSIVDHAQDLYDNSSEGENIGQYASGARAELLSVINSVNSQISSTMSSEAISQCTSDINAAIELFQSKKVNAGEDTNISVMNNVIYIERVESAAGNQLTLSIKMKNNIEVQGYQFDLYLPEGVTVAKDEDGFAMAELSTARTTVNKTNYFDTATTPDGALRVLCGSSKGYTFSGIDGEVALITVNISQEMEEGEYPIILKTIKLSDKNSVPYSTEYVKSTLVVSSYTLGDVNADGSIDVADFIAIANHILGNTSDGFVEKAADVNEDNAIDVADFIGVANMILHSTSGSQHIAARRAPRKVASNVSAMENAIYVEPVTVAAGSQQVLSVRMKNAEAVAGFQFNMQLPDGITFATDDDDAPLAELSTERTTSRRTNYFDSAIQDDGTLMVLCGTTNKNAETDALYAFSGNDGEVARITINVPADYAAGEYPVIIKDAIISDPEASKTNLQKEIESTLTVESTDGRVLLAETATTKPETALNVDVRVQRTIKANQWSTIVLPFAMTNAQMKEAFGNDVELADFTGYEAEEDGEGNIVGITVNFANATAIEANHPYIIKVSEAITEFTVDGVDVEPEDEPVVATVKRTRKQWSEMIGTYVAETEIPSKTLFLNSNKFYYSTGATKMKAFRAYFDFFDVLTDVDNSYEVKMFVDGAETKVEGLGVKDAAGNVYDLSGRKVSKAQRGVYIVNGKKVLVK